MHEINIAGLNSKTEGNASRGSVARLLEHFKLDVSEVGQLLHGAQRPCMTESYLHIQKEKCAHLRR